MPKLNAIALLKKNHVVSLVDSGFTPIKSAALAEDSSLEAMMLALQGNIPNASRFLSLIFAKPF